MISIPTLRTPRLILRPFTPDDAPVVQHLAGVREVAEMTTNIPYPYEDGIAKEWIATHQPSFENGEAVTFAIVLDQASQLIGAIGLRFQKAHLGAELGYWIGKMYWNQGYCTEAARAVIRYGFESFHLNRIQARHMTKNPASGRVMQKVGMQYEGTLRQSLVREDQFYDAAIYSILCDEFLAAKKAE
ncbi:MAG: GNAT family N-acetyltransferase [candidate division KSB1 bacterium]|nr:GNAT family N-acetyltransferase [candidate division KSB1 bacterium]